MMMMMIDADDGSDDDDDDDDDDGDGGIFQLLEPRKAFPWFTPKTRGEAQGTFVYFFRRVKHCVK